MEKLSADERAYELLKWQALAPLSQFDEAYPYAKAWKLYSDAAIKAWDKENPYETSSELAAFRELERLGVFTQSDFYSPSQAANGVYTKRLRRHTKDQDQRTAQLPQAGSTGDCPEPPGRTVDAAVEIRRRRARTRARRQRS